MGFLEKIARDTYRYLVDADTGEGIPSNWIDADGNRGDYAAPEEIAFHTLAHVGAYEMGIIGPRAAYMRVRRGLQSLNQLEKNSEGLYYRYYQASTGAVDAWDVPSIGNAMVVAAMMVVAEWADDHHFHALQDRAEEIIDGVDLRNFYHSAAQLFYHNYSGGSHWDYYSDEGRLLSFIARARGDITKNEFRRNLHYLEQAPYYFSLGTGETVAHPNSPYDIRVDKASWDGSLFTYVVPALFIQERVTAYQSETINPAIAAQQFYAAKEGFPFWGFSDAYNPAGNYCWEYQGAPPYAADYLYNHLVSCYGVVTPHATALALLSDHDEDAYAMLSGLSLVPGLYDDQHGFYDSLDMTTGEVSNKMVTLDQEWIFLSLMNYLDNTLWRYFYRAAGVCKTHTEMYSYPFGIPECRMITYHTP
jgi:hypothetical protein